MRISSGIVFAFVMSAGLSGPAQADEVSPGALLRQIAPVMQMALDPARSGGVRALATPGLSTTGPDGIIVKRSMLSGGRVRLEYENGFAEERHPGGYQVFDPEGSMLMGSTFVVVPGESMVMEGLSEDMMRWLDSQAIVLLSAIRSLGGGAEAEANYLGYESGQAATVIDRIDMRSRYLSMLIGY